MLLRLIAIVHLAPYFHAISEASVLLDQSADAVQVASTENGGLTTEGVSTLDGVQLDAIPEGRSAEAVMSTSIPKTDWTITVDSYQPDHPPANVLDDDLTTFWHTTYTPGASPLLRTGVRRILIFFSAPTTILWIASDTLAPELALDLNIPGEKGIC